MPQHVGDRLPEHPAEDVARGGADRLGVAPDHQRDPGGVEHGAGPDQLGGKIGAACLANQRSHLGERLAGHPLHLLHLGLGAVEGRAAARGEPVGGQQPGGELALERDHLQRVPEDVVQVVGEPQPLAGGGELGGGAPRVVHVDDGLEPPEPLDVDRPHRGDVERGEPDREPRLHSVGGEERSGDEVAPDQHDDRCADHPHGDPAGPEAPDDVAEQHAGDDCPHEAHRARGHAGEHRGEADDRGHEDEPERGGPSQRDAVPPDPPRVQAERHDEQGEHRPVREKALLAHQHRVRRHGQHPGHGDDQADHAEPPSGLQLALLGAAQR
nr:hypothetical protein [Pseudonocardia nigra]